MTTAPEFRPQNPTMPANRSGTMMHDDLVDRIYECSVVPEAWPAALDEVAALAGSTGGLLFSARKALNWTASNSVADAFDAYVNDGWFGKCSRRACLMSQDAPSFFVEYDFWSEEELRADPVYRDFFRPRGLGWSAGTALQLPTGDNIVFSVERAFDGGPIEPENVARLNMLRPHIARSALVSARLQMKRAEGATEALAGLGSDAGDQVRSFPIGDAAGNPELVAHIVPVRRSAHDVFGDSFALMLLIPVASERAPSATLMKSLFDLTPSEARVARGIAGGDTPDEIAADGDVAISTVRSQLRRVLGSGPNKRVPVPL
ncbi:MAG: hypothetical protein JNL35_13100 [Sphingopyxis sp.]|nr:hypothetical protein [Sphingopyxis sp.]